MANYADRRVWAMTAAEAKLDELRKEKATATKTKAIYREANKDIQRRVQNLYDELATQDDQNAWRFEGLNTPATTRSAKELREKIEAAGLTDYVPERLQRRLSVYEVMELDNWYTITKAGQDAHKTLKNALNDEIKDTGEIWQKAMEAGGASFVGFDRNQVGYLLGENWYGGNFSSRLWDETQANWEKVQTEIAKALSNGQDPQTTRKRIEQILVGVHRDGVRGSGGLSYDVERIIRTEMARAATQADIIKWQDEGVAEIQWNARLEANTCEHCAERDGRVYKLKQAHDLVPLHPNCRCFLTPYDRVAEKARGEQERKRQYKDEDGEYQEITWAPITALMKRDAGRFSLTGAVAKVGSYFLESSPWTQYEPAKTGVQFIGETNKYYTELAETAIKDVINQYPQVGYELKNTYQNQIYEHRGMSATIGNGLDTIGGVVFPSGKNQVGVALAYPSTLTGTAKAIRETMAEMARKQYTQNFWSTDKVQHSIVHEMGHVLENYIRKRADKKKGESAQAAGDRAIREILEAATGAKGQTATLNAIRENISKYGGKNLSEGFAELFARSMAQDTNLNNKTVAQFVSKLNQVREKLPQKARTTKINVVSKAQVSQPEPRLTNYQDWINALTEDEQIAVDNYKRGHTILSKVRRQKRENIYWLDDTEYAKELRASKNLENAINKFTLEKEQTVWRGIRSDSRLDMMGKQSDPQSIEFVKQLKDIKVGQTFTDSGFSSTSIDKEIAVGRIFNNDASVLVKIKIPAGKGIAAQIDDFTIPKNRYSERELLLNANSKFKVVGKKMITITNPFDVTAQRQITQLELELIP